MSTNDALTPKQKELVAVGASIAAGCRPCTEHHFDAARQAGVTDAEIRRAVDCALAIRERSGQLMATLADQLLDTPPRRDLPERVGGTVIDELVAAAAALAVNWVAGVEDHLTIAKALGASGRQIQNALGMARLVKKVAGQKVDAAAAACGGPPEPDAGSAACTG
jgi:AhpD family alkylhydroperoxidase